MMTMGGTEGEAAEQVRVARFVDDWLNSAPKRRKEYERIIASGDKEGIPEAAFNLGILLNQSSDSAGARRAFQIAIDSGHSLQARRAAFALGQLLGEMGDTDGARAAYQLVIDSGDSPYSAIDLGGCSGRLVIPGAHALLTRWRSTRGMRRRRLVLPNSRHPSDVEERPIPCGSRPTDWLQSGRCASVFITVTYPGQQRLRQLLSSPGQTN